MAPEVDDTDILNKIQTTYVPFLKKLIAFLEKNKKATPENLTKLRAIYTIFTTANSREQIETFHANQKKLENWYNKAQKDKQSEEGDASKGSKRSFTCSDTESSQGAFDTNQPVSKKSCTFANAVDSDSSQPAILKVQSVRASLPVDVANIKKEKEDAPKPKDSTTTTTPKPPPQQQDDGPIVYTCASCQFQTQEESEFMKHARTDHRTDLSMWCKQCGKCFSNAGVLVSHIKERACVREEMVYRCGVKECAFETSSGQTFVHHLRHCHKGSPFIFCVHCQKIFTLPHCLILHMQDDCPFKDKNRRTGVAVATKTPTPAPAAVAPPVKPKPVQQQQPPPPVRPIAPRMAAPQTNSNVRTPPAPPPRGGGRGRGSRGRGRGRGRVRVSDSSDSDDPDDPSWRPEELLGETGLRRSGRWAKKVNDVMNPTEEEASTSGGKRSFVPSAEMMHCPCCDFMAAFQSVLEDHYIAHHKVPNKNSCLVCHLKFENTRSFLEHFEEHRKGSLPNGPPPALLEMANKAATPDADRPATTTVAKAPAPDAKPPTTTTTNSNAAERPVPPTEVVKSDDPYGLLIGMSDARLMDASACRDKAVKIPYQSAIHDKNMKDWKLSKFEELKSPADLRAMKTPDKLRHYFKCALYACTFTTDSSTAFADHLRLEHEGKRHHCCYCLKEELSGAALVRHVVARHGTRTFQCSRCFYRACSRPHLEVHEKNAHPGEGHTNILLCEAPPHAEKEDEQQQEEEPSATTWPYICAIGPCDFSTYDPKEFKRHNEMSHRTVSVFFCFYCKVDFLTFKRLMNHYRLHGLNQFQCSHCVHGAETRDEMLKHLCNVHPDRPLSAYMRGTGDEGTGGKEAKKDDKQKGCDDGLLYHVVENDCFPAHMRSRRYPRYLSHLATDVVCGVPFCDATFASIDLYAEHLRAEHGALTLPCPHCPEMSATWEDFKNHLLCHASKLYACGNSGCGFYGWNREAVKGHAKTHEGSEVGGVVAIREFAALDEENKVHALSVSWTADGLPGSTCAFCGFKSGDRRLMKNHLYRELGYRRFECALCGTRCTSRAEAKEHFGTAHPDADVACAAEQNFELEAAVRAALQRPEVVCTAETCNSCCGKIGIPSHLQAHLIRCLRKEDKPYACGTCGSGFASLLPLRHHWDEKHAPARLDFVHAPNDAVEEDFERNLLRLRLGQLKEALGAGVAEDAPRKVKFYTCSECPFESHHKHNVQRHSRLSHDGAAKVMKGVESGAGGARRFGCGLCARKCSSRHEVERHVRKAHDDEQRFYYFSPAAADDDEEDGRVYECAYCKSTREALSALRKHADLLHPDMEFKVKGFVAGQQPERRGGLACGHCYLRVAGSEELLTHSAAAHPLLESRALGDAAPASKRECPDKEEGLPNKRVRFGSSVFVCRHCGGAFSSEDQVSVHCRRAHSRLSPLFDVGDEQRRFYKCEFCRFTGERPFLERHLAAKHKMRVTCSHCHKRFEFASRLKEHHDVAHAGLPLSYSQETLAKPAEPAPEPEEASRYGQKLDPVDLGSITVHMEMKEGRSAELPLIYVTERFNLFPKVVVRDVMKDKED